MPNIAALTRLRYFNGQLLSAEDRRDEQSYLLDRWRRHNRFLHGWGVVSGLEVKVDNGADIEVAPGIAIDCAGNELVVPSTLRLAIPSGADRFYVSLTYAELLSGAVPAPDDQTACSRIQETVALDLSLTNAAALHRGKGAGTPGCGAAHAVCIASITRRGKGWQVRRRNFAA